MMFLAGLKFTSILFLLCFLGIFGFVTCQIVAMPKCLEDERKICAQNNWDPSQCRDYLCTQCGAYCGD